MLTIAFCRQNNRVIIRSAVRFGIKSIPTQKDGRYLNTFKLSRVHTNTQQNRRKFSVERFIIKDVFLAGSSKAGCTSCFCRLWHIPNIPREKRSGCIKRSARAILNGINGYCVQMFTSTLYDKIWYLKLIAYDIVQLRLGCLVLQLVILEVAEECLVYKNMI